MSELFRQLASNFGAAFAAVCCAGASWALAALTAVGAGFLVNDAVLIPLYAALLALSVWFLHRTAGLWTWLAAIWAGLGALIAAKVRHGGTTENAGTAPR